MRLHRFFIKEHIGDETVLISDTDLLHQWKNVFRYQVGTQVILLDSSGYEFLAILTEFSNREAVCKIVSKHKGVVGRNETWLFMSMIKKDRFEMVVEKATELGISYIVPVRAERSVPMNIKTDRLETIAREASEQCGRATLPTICEIMDLGEALVCAKEKGLEIYVGDQDGVTSATVDKRIGFFVGPEGGYDDREKGLFTDSGAIKVSLGDLVLRAETAAIVLISKCI